MAGSATVTRPAGAPVGAVEQAASSELGSLLATALETLPEKVRAAVVMHYGAGLKQRQIAQELNISPTTVKSHVEIILRKFGVSSRVALRVLLAPLDLNAYL